MLRVGNRNPKPYTVGFFGTFASVGAVILYLFATSFNPDSLYAFFTMFGVLLAGVVFSKFFVGWQLAPLTLKNVVADVMSTAVSAIALYYVNRFVPVELGVTPFGQFTFAILNGVAEEWLFRLFLCAWIDRVTGAWWLALPISSFGWAWFHLARASAFGAVAVNWSYIWLVFLAGIPLGAVTLYFKSADGPTFAHMLINGLAEM